jgi:small-conductance mechanosensitive channel
MGKHRFASTETARLELTEGDWIEVKDELSYGERQVLMSVGVKRTGVTEETRAVEIDWSVINVADMAMWVVDWSFTDDVGVRVPVSEDSIRALSLEAANEVNEALKAHKARAEKNVTTTDGSPEQTPK